MSKAVTHQVNVEKNDDWETPPDILEKVCKKYKINPTLDVCATKLNFKCPVFITPEMNALEKEWSIDFFMNPPYSEINQWMEKAYTEHRKHNVDALILVFAKTSVQWWHKYVEGKAETHFQKGRIRFLFNGVEPRYCKHCKKRFAEEITHCKICNRKIGKSSPTYDSVWVIFRKTKKICKSCDTNPLFENQITCESCHANCKPEELT